MTAALLPERFGQKLAGNADIESPDLTHRHIVHFQVGRQVCVPVGGERHFFGRPVDEVAALLTANLPLAVEEILMMRVLAESDPAPDALVPRDLLLMVMGKAARLADRVPVQPVGRGVYLRDADAAGAVGCGLIRAAN